MVAQIKEVDAPTLKGWLDRGEAVLVDVRDPDEFAREHIAGATLVPLPTLAPGSIPGAAGKKVVVHCRSGHRSSEACARLLGAGVPETYSLKGGMAAWKAAGQTTQVNRSVPISIMRQVQIVVGAAVVIGTALAWTVSPWFLILPGFFGAGLLFAGVTGTCALAAMLSMMPWNKGMRCEANCSG